MRVIDADDLLKQKPFTYIGGQVNSYCAGFLDCAQEAREAVNNAPTLTPPTEWVSVEERLPGVSGNYICAVKDKNGGKWTIPSEWNLEMKTWFGAFGEIKNKVTHWMPLPAPPDRRPPEGEA